MRLHANKMNINKSTQHKILAIHFFAESIERFNYWGIQSVILLYLTKFLSLSTKDSYLVYGSFTALTFIMSIIGGLMADRLFGYRRVFLLGIFSSLLGMIFLATGYVDISICLSLVICGTGLFLPTNANLLASFYNDLDVHSKEKGFGILYMGANIGGLLGPIIYGLLSIYGWKYVFSLGAIFITSWLVFYGYSKDLLKENERIISSKYISKSKVLLFFMLNFISFFIVYICMKHPLWSGKILFVVGSLTIFSIIFIASCKSPLERNRILYLIAMIGIALLFFTCVFQIYTSIIIFINEYINRSLFGWKVPSSMFSSLEPFFVIILSPIMIRGWLFLKSISKEPSHITKLAIGLILASASFLSFAISGYCVNEYPEFNVIILILIGNILLGAGELCIMPPLISAISLFAPKAFKGTIMGLLYLSLAFSGYFAGKIAGLTGGDHLIRVSALNYSLLYAKIALLVLVIGTVIIVTSAVIKRHKFSVCLLTNATEESNDV
jgi:POT family proton-dependent oligopeptide transporter